MTADAPIGLLAELTHRCPLRCPYCSNPLDLERRGAEMGTAAWLRVIDEARELGILQVHLSGGEPTVRQDLEQMVSRCGATGIYSNLITSGVLLDRRRIDALAAAGLDHVQLSVQDAEGEAADRVAGLAGAHDRKRACAEAIVAAGLPLTINFVVHRHNVHSILQVAAMAAELGASRLEVAHTQYHGWAAENRSALMPTGEQARESVGLVDEARTRFGSTLQIDFVPPDHYARLPKACMGGWGRRSLNVTPSGKVLPCHAAETVPGLEFWSVNDRPLKDIWKRSPAFNAFRGTAWMMEPCIGCERRDACLGGCRCQALALTGNAAAADPVCERSPFHADIRRMAADAAGASDAVRYRG